MFDNIGKKIKAWVKIVCFIEIAIFIIIAIVMFAVAANEFAERRNFVGYLILGFFFLSVGPLLTWITSFFMYGFGELVDKVCDIERNTHNYTKSAVQSEVDSARINNIEKLRSQGLITEEEYLQAISKEFT